MSEWSTSVKWSLRYVSYSSRNLTAVSLQQPSALSSKMGSMTFSTSANSGPGGGYWPSLCDMLRSHHRGTPFGEGSPSANENGSVSASTRVLRRSTLLRRRMRSPSLILEGTSFASQYAVFQFDQSGITKSRNGSASKSLGSGGARRDVIPSFERVCQAPDVANEYLGQQYKGEAQYNPSASPRVGVWPCPSVAQRILRQN